MTRSIIICILYQIYYRDQISGDEMDGAYSKSAYKMLGRDYLRGLRVDGRLTLK